MAAGPWHRSCLAGMLRRDRSRRGTNRRAPSVERSGASQVFVALEQRYRPVDEDTHLRAEIAVWRVDHVDGDRGGAPTLEQRHEAARRDGLMNGIRRRLDDAQAYRRLGTVCQRPAELL